MQRVSNKKTVYYSIEIVFIVCFRYRTRNAIDNGDTNDVSIFT